MTSDSKTHMAATSGSARCARTPPWPSPTSQGRGRILASEACTLKLVPLALSGLRLAIENNPGFASSLRAELQQALGDHAYSWRDVLERYDVVVVADEQTARQYVKQLAVGRHFLLREHVGPTNLADSV